MKKPKLNNRYGIKTTVIIVISILALIGCNPKEIKDDKNNNYDKIQSTNLTKDEKNLLGAAGIDKYFVFDFKLLDAEEKRANIWVDYYENGEYNSKISSGEFSFGNQDNSNEGKIILVINDLPGNVSQREFVVSLMDDSGFSSGTINVPKRKKDLYLTWKSIKEKEVNLKENINLAVIVENNKEQNIVIDDTIFENDKEALLKLMKYDNVYILRCLFK